VDLARRLDTTVEALEFYGNGDNYEGRGTRPSAIEKDEGLTARNALAAIDPEADGEELHHFTAHDALQLIREMHRVARRRVVIADLRRSWVAVAGLWLVSFPLGFHQVSRHDGVVSILRGFEVSELRALVRDAIGIVPEVRRRLGWRVTASWSP
jgi:hypothetical protein